MPDYILERRLEATGGAEADGGRHGGDVDPRVKHVLLESLSYKIK